MREKRVDDTSTIVMYHAGASAQQLGESLVARDGGLLTAVWCMWRIRIQCTCQCIVQVHMQQVAYHSTVRTLRAPIFARSHPHNVVASPI